MRRPIYLFYVLGTQKSEIHRNTEFLDSFLGYSFNLASILITFSVSFLSIRRHVLSGEKHPFMGQVETSPIIIFFLCYRKINENSAYDTCSECQKFHCSHETNIPLKNFASWGICNYNAPGLSEITCTLKSLM